MQVLFYLGMHVCMSSRRPVACAGRPYVSTLALLASVTGPWLCYNGLCCSYLGDLTCLSTCLIDQVQRRGGGRGLNAGLGWASQPVANRNIFRQRSTIRHIFASSPSTRTTSLHASSGLGSLVVTNNK